MKKIGITSSGSVIVEMTTAQFDALTHIQTPSALTTPAASVEAVKMTLAERVTFVRERISKLKPKKKEGVIHSITAMFQFTGGISESEIQRIVAALQKEKFITIDANDRVTYNGG